eukprot:GHVQ01012401.1.p1 GENE.GHVQ01012401.1~~GHVQ01012401.1.p1  ORF type:complete len:163 (+),score=13.03 GHVQ01012401.1:193-681(+)
MPYVVHAVVIFVCPTPSWFWVVGGGAFVTTTTVVMEVQILGEFGISCNAFSEEASKCFDEKGTAMVVEKRDTEQRPSLCELLLLLPQSLVLLLPLQSLLLLLPLQSLLLLQPQLYYNYCNVFYYYGLCYYYNYYDHCHYYNCYYNHNTTAMFDTTMIVDVEC